MNSGKKLYITIVNQKGEWDTLSGYLNSGHLGFKLDHIYSSVQSRDTILMLIYIFSGLRNVLKAPIWLYWCMKDLFRSIHTTLLAAEGNNSQNYIKIHWILTSAWSPKQSNQFLLSESRMFMTSATHLGHSKDVPDWVDIKVDLWLSSAHRACTCKDTLVFFTNSKHIYTHSLCYECNGIF